MSLARALDLRPLELFAANGILDLSSTEERRKAFTCYLAIRDKITTDYLPNVSSRQPFINDHSRTHLTRVLKNLEHLLGRHFPSRKGGDVPEGRLLSWVDTLILLNALVWHDLGNVRGRKGHANQVHELFDLVAGKLYDDPLAEYIKLVAEAHSGEGAIRRVIPDSRRALSYHGDPVHLQFLAAALRFCDELDEDQRRISTQDWEVLGELPEEAQRYWFFNRVNSSIRITTEMSDRTLDSEVEIISHIPQSEFSRKFKTETGQIQALTEYLRRLQKIENERKYCNPFLATAYYHSGVGRIRAQLHTHERLAAGVSSATEIVLDNSLSMGGLLGNAQFSHIHEFVQESMSHE